MNPHGPAPVPLHELELPDAQKAHIFCSSPFFLRHALTILALLQAKGIAVTLWSEVGGSVAPALTALAIKDVALRQWPALPFRTRLSRPWSFLQTRRFWDRFFEENLRDLESTLVFYEGDYPQPGLHALVARAARSARTFKFSHSGHDTFPVPRVPAGILIRSQLLARAFGIPVHFFARPGLADSSYLSFFDSRRCGVTALEVPLSPEALAAFRKPIAAGPGRPVLLLLESRHEDETCLDYDRQMNAVLDGLAQRGWQVFAKGHPRLGSSQTILRRGLPTLDARIPLELFDLSNVGAVLGFCSSAMFSSADLGIPTYSLETMFERRDPHRRAWAVNYLQTDPGWNRNPIRITFLPNLKSFPHPPEPDGVTHP